MLCQTILFLIVHIVTLMPEKDIDNLGRVLREISIENTTETNLNITSNNSTSSSNKETQQEDPEADKFIEYLKNLSSSQNKIKNEYRQKDELSVPHDENFTKSNISDIIYNETLIKHPELMFLTKLNGSSFRIKLMLNKTWSKDLLYPSNNEYAKLERALVSEFNSAYENHSDYINIHLLSFNYRDKDSFYSDFILNFQNRDNHLFPFLKIIARGMLGEIPINIENLTAYVIEINPASIDACKAVCDEQHCRDRQCPPECCENITISEKKLINISVSDNKKVPDNTSDLADFGFNSSQIQEEVLKIIQGISNNVSLSDDRTTLQISKNEDLKNIQQQPYEQSRTFLENNYNHPYDYYSSILSNSEYKYPQSLLQPSYDNGMVLHPQNSIYKNEDDKMLDKRGKIPEIPSYIQPNFQSSNLFSMVPTNNIQTNQHEKNSRYLIYYPKMPSTNYMASESLKSRKSEVNNANYRIWYPKV